MARFNSTLLPNDEEGRKVTFDLLSKINQLSDIVADVESQLDNLIDEDFISGNGSFNDTPFATNTITHNFNKGTTDYYVMITPTVQTSGQLGEISVINKTENTFDIVKTGSATGITFDYLVTL